MSKNTIQSISDATGYSVSTVSRVLSGKAAKSRISEAAVELITAEARRINYTPNLLAQSLRTKKTHTIGLTVPGVDNPFFANLASIVIENLKQEGYHTLLADSRERVEDFEDGLKMFRSRNVDGIIAVPVGTKTAFLEDIADSIPTVLVDRYFENSSLPYICTDNLEGGQMAADYLIRKGYRNILALQGIPDSTASMARLEGFRNSIAAHPELSIKQDVVGYAFSEESGYKSVMETFGKGKSYDAVFAFSSTILLGAIRAFHELGLRIPQDVAIISFDNNGFLDYLDPSVTRVEQPLAEIGKLATDVLMQFIALKARRSSEKPETVQMNISPNLVVRNSC